jgi:hypothetical protein
MGTRLAAYVEGQHRRGGKEINWTKLPLMPCRGRE